MTNPKDDKIPRVVVPMHSDARVAPRADRAITSLEPWIAAARVGFVAGVMQSVLDLLRTVRFIGNDTQLDAALMSFLELCDELEDFFGKLPVAAPTERGDVRVFAARLKEHISERHHELEAALRSVSGQLQTLKAEHDHIQHEDRRALDRLIATLAGVAARFRDEVQAERDAKALTDIVEQLTRRIAELEMRDVAALHSVAGERAAHLGLLLDKFERAARRLSSSDTAGPVVADSVSSIDDALVAIQLGARLKWFEACQAYQDEAQDEYDTVSARLTECDERVKFSEGAALAEAQHEALRLRQRQLLLTEYLRHLAELQTHERRVLDWLRRAQEARALLSTGVPEALRESLAAPLPSVPSLADAFSAGGAGSISAGGGNTDRFDALRTIASSTGMTPSAVLILSLFDCLPELPGKEYPYIKSAVTVAAAAYRVGIAAQFGWKNHNDLLSSWKRESGEIVSDPIVPLLTYRGKVLYKRTGKSLPWNPRDILSAEEINLFQQRISERDADTRAERESE